MPWQYSWVDPAGGKEKSGKGTAASPKNNAAIVGDQWQCAWCQSKNATGKTKCAGCGLRRSVKKVAANAPSAEALAAEKHPATSQNKTRQDMDKVVALLQQAAPSPSTPPTTTAMTTTEAGSKEASISAAAGTPSTGLSKDEVNAIRGRVKSLEETLKLIPDSDDFIKAREDIQMRLDKAKSELRNTKPLGARIDASRMALQRAQQRTAQAKEATELAIQVHAKAVVEEEETSAQLTALEKEWTAQVVEEASASDTIQSLKSSLTGVMKVLAKKPGMEQISITQAQTHMDSLLRGLVACMADADKKCPADVKRRADTDWEAAWEEAVAVPRQRHRGKEPPSQADAIAAATKVAAAPPVGHRCTGKKTLFDYWKGGQAPKPAANAVPVASVTPGNTARIRSRSPHLVDESKL